MLNSVEHSFILMSCTKYFSQKTSFVVVTKRQKKLEISKGGGRQGGGGVNEGERLKLLNPVTSKTVLEPHIFLAVTS